MPTLWDVVGRAKLGRPNEPPPRPIHIVHREGRHPSTKVRAFIDLVAERLRGERALDPTAL